MNKLTFKKILSEWLIFLVYAVFFILISTWIIDLINKPRGKETISIFLTSYEADTNSLYNELKEVSPEYLREIDLKQYRLDDQYFNTFYQAIALGNSDIVIIPESYLNDSLGITFMALDMEYISEYTGLTFDESDLFTSYDHTFAIKIYDKDEGKSNEFIKFFKEDFPETEDIDESVNESYYIVFYKKSVHLGKMTESESTLALDYLKVFLNYEKNEGS